MAQEQHTVIPSNRNRNLIFVTVAVLLCLFFGYIDEGYNNFNWMADLDNWIAFAMYFLILYGGQLLFSKVLLKNLNGWGNVLLSIIGGTVGILGSIFLILYLLTR